MTIETSFYFVDATIREAMSLSGTWLNSLTTQKDDIVKMYFFFPHEELAQDFKHRHAKLVSETVSR